MSKPILFRAGFLAALTSAVIGFSLRASANESADSAAESKSVVNLSEFKDENSRYSMLIPKGYKRLSEEKIRENVRSNSEIVGKDITEQILREPAAYFEGPIDPARPKVAPPILKLLTTGLDEAVDPTLLSKYKERYENGVRKHGDTVGNVDVSSLTVNGVHALHFEHELFDRLDNSRRHIIDISIPGPGRRYEIVFNYSTDQDAGVREAAETIIKSFKVLEDAFIAPESSSKWVRIALWTLGGLIAGILLGVLLGVVTGKNQTNVIRDT